jgi:hypothetical protein
VRIRGQKIFGRSVKVSEIATTATGNEDFFADAVGVLEYGDAAAAFACFESAEEAGGAGAEHQNIKGTGQNDLTVFL